MWVQQYHVLPSFTSMSRACGTKGNEWTNSQVAAADNSNTRCFLTAGGRLSLLLAVVSAQKTREQCILDINHVQLRMASFR